MTDLFPARVRGLQAIYAGGHKALVNWGAYSRDRAGFERGVTSPRTAKEYHYTEGDEEGYADPHDACLVLIRTNAPAKAEKVQDEPYNERDAAILCERMHGPGGLMVEARPVLKVAYVLRYIQEYEYPYRTGLLPDTVLERLEMGLRFAARFA